MQAETQHFLEVVWKKKNGTSATTQKGWKKKSWSEQSNLSR